MFRGRGFVMRILDSMIFELGFPRELRSKVRKVLGEINTKTFNNISPGFSDEYMKEEYVLLDGSWLGCAGIL